MVGAQGNGWGTCAGGSSAPQVRAHFTIPAIRKLITYSEQASGS